MQAPLTILATQPAAIAQAASRWREKTAPRGDANR
jgi:hypothetical protein